jgi:hypothetical protein
MTDVPGPAALKTGGKERRAAMNAMPTAAAAGKIDAGGDLRVNRPGFGAMRITGSGMRGDPPDRSERSPLAALSR